MRESDVETYFAQRVAAAGGMTRKLIWVGRRGAPDRIVVYQGRVFFVELKALGKKLRASQAAEHAALAEHAADVHTLDSMQDVDAFVAAMRDRDGA